MDPGRRAVGRSTGWAALVAKLLETSLPLVTPEYDFDMMIRLVRTIEDALTRTELPAIISGEDDTNGLNWFMD
jgi:Zn-dependent M32 family carboxypeptidase